MSDRENRKFASLRERLVYNEDFELDWHDPDEAHDGYQLKWVGKTYARLEAGTAATTMIYPDVKHNQRQENAHSQNLFFTGDNLQVLKHLQNCYKGAVKMIYIDPPYNTGSDGFVYKDKFDFPDAKLKAMLGLTDDEVKRLKIINGRSSHSAWLTFMYPRLKIAQELLCDDGIIFISIDDNEQANLKLLCDEIFGEVNFVGEFTWETKRAARGVPPTTLLMTTHEYVLCYAKYAVNIKFKGLERDRADFSNPDGDIRGLWRSESMKATGGQNNYFSIVNPENGMSFYANWAFSENTVRQMIQGGLVLFPDSKSGTPRQKKFFNSYTNETKAAVTALGWFSTEKTTKELVSLLERDLFKFPKPVALIKFFCEQSASDKISELSGTEYTPPPPRIFATYYNT